MNFIEIRIIISLDVNGIVYIFTLELKVKRKTSFIYTGRGHSLVVAFFQFNREDSSIYVTNIREVVV